MRDIGTEFDDKSDVIGTRGLIAIGVVGMLAILLTGVMAMISVVASDNTEIIAPTIRPTVAPTIAPTPKLTVTPTAAPVYFDGRKYGAPGNMVPDPNYKGVYIGNLGGTVAFIDIETYLANGGACRVGNINGVPLYTRFGMDSQSMYDPDTGIVSSLIEDPWDMELYNEKRGALGYV
jgi:hypothetical protein